MRIKVLVSAALLLSACAANPDRFVSTPTSQLCMDYLSLPAGNVWQPSRAAELDRRGESCGNYTGPAAVRQRANADAMRNAIEASKALQPAPADIRQGTHTYLINGKSITCTTTGAITNCN